MINLIVSSLASLARSLVPKVFLLPVPSSEMGWEKRDPGNEVYLHAASTSVIIFNYLILGVTPFYSHVLRRTKVSYLRILKIMIEKHQEGD